MTRFFSTNHYQYHFNNAVNKIVSLVTAKMVADQKEFELHNERFLTTQERNVDKAFGGHPITLYSDLITKQLKVYTNELRAALEKKFLHSNYNDHADVWVLKTDKYGKLAAPIQEGASHFLARVDENVRKQMQEFTSSGFLPADMEMVFWGSTLVSCNLHSVMGKEESIAWVKEFNSYMGHTGLFYYKDDNTLYCVGREKLTPKDLEDLEQEEGVQYVRSGLFF